MLESRRAEDGSAVRRRRACPACAHRFTTFERAAAEPRLVRKRSGELQRFDRAKLRAALLRSTHKRQVSATDVEALVDRVELDLGAHGGELGAERIGELCLEGLADLDHGAYLQFLGTLPSSNTDFADTAPTLSVRGAGQHAKFPPKPPGRP